ncbi:hypothetical protein CCMA1212_003425 [Trichoderma ghanense]|uniref:Uncharacterized protein n=1 Tax=Trichoderma ghanense TaxID=65468 RepID=A0ABY2HBR1_9HYPO
MTAMPPAGRLGALNWTELFGFYPSPGPFAPAGRAGSTTRRRLHRASSSRHGSVSLDRCELGPGVWA